MEIPEQLGPEPDTLAEFTAKERKKPVIDWYRTPIPAAEFKALHKKSDIKGAIQTLGYLGILAATGFTAFHSFRHWPWQATVALVFAHGMMTAFLINGVHELGHGTVFQTKRLNRFFCHILAFLGWINHETFHASHTRHHRYTLHPPDDLEVVLPLRLMIRHFVLTGGGQEVMEANGHPVGEAALDDGIDTLFGIHGMDGSSRFIPRMIRQSARFQCAGRA